MNKFYRLLSIVLVFITIFNFYGCFNPTESNSEDTINENAYSPIEDIKFNLTYMSNDTLDPFTATSDINRNILSLLYDSLYAVDNTFKPIPQIAESYKLNGNDLVVTIKSGLTFSDGSFVSVSDVAYSFEKAKASDRYGNDLSSFDSADVSGAHDITFKLNSLVQDAVSLLTFPIVKIEEASTDETDITATTGLTDETENTSISFNTPIGSGRYYFKKDENNVFYLTCNIKRLGGYFPLYRNIGLIGTVDTEQIKSMYSLGTTNIVFDTYPSGDYTQILGSSARITLPNFVYLGCNNNNTVLQDTVVKKAISYAIDRAEICNYSFIGNATATQTPFHNDYYKTKSYKSENKDYNDAINLLESNGYDQVNSAYNFRYNSEDTSKVLEFRLAVCSNNSFKISAAEKIKEQLAKANIRIEIYKYTETDFFNVLSSDSYDLYLGECKMKYNLDLSGFFTSGNNLSIGIDTYGSSSIAYTSYKNGETDINSFLKVFTEDYPFIPLLYRSGNAFSNSAMSVADETILTDYYYNIDKWKTIND